MTTPSCPDHGRLALDLALGQLDDRAAEQAEEVRGSCPTCRAWWSEHLEGEPAALVDDEIASVFASFETPRRRHVSPWLAAAAAVLVAFGALVLMQGLGPSDPPASVAAGGEALFVDGLESGDLAGWVLEAGEPTARVAVAEAEADSDQLFVSDLEAGDLSGWSS